MAVELLAGLIVLTVVVTEFLKTLSKPKNRGTLRCRVCGELMEEVPYNWAYRLPFEMWATVSKYNLPPQSVRRFGCPQKHSFAWFLPKAGERECEVLVTKIFSK